MKTKLIVITIFCLFLSSCKYEPPCYSIAVSINTDENTIRNNNWTYIRTKVNSEITGYYFWLPFNPKDPSIENIISTDDNIISITNIDYDKQTFTALAKQTGTAKIRVVISESKNKYSSSLDLIVIE